MSKTGTSSKSSSKKDLFEKYPYKGITARNLLFRAGDRQIEPSQTLTIDLFSLSKDDVVIVPLKGIENDFDKIPVSKSIDSKAKRKSTRKPSTSTGKPVQEDVEK